MTRSSSTVLRLVAVMTGVWWRTSARLLGGRCRRNVTVAVVTLGCVAWCVVASRSIDTGIDAAGNDDVLFQSLVLIVLALGLIVSAVANLYLSGTTVLDSIVAVLPISAFERLLANRLATAVVATIATAAGVTPLVWPLLVSADGINLALGGVSLMLVLLIGVVLAHASSLATLVVHQRWRPLAPAAVAEQRAGVISACCATLVFATAARRGASSGDSSRPLPQVASIVRRASHGSVGHLALVAGCLGAMSVLAVVLARRAARSQWRQVDHHSAALMDAVRAAPPQLRTVMLETAVWTRNRYNRGTLGVLAVGGTFTFVLSVLERSSSRTVLVAASLPGVTALIGASMFGGTSMWHWVYVTTGRPTRWVAPKLTAAALVWTLLIVPVAVLGAVAGAWGAGDIGAVGGLSSIQFTAVVITGLLVPATAAHSMQALSNFFLTIAVSTVSLPLLLTMPVVGDSGIAVAAFGVLLAGLCVALYRQRAVADGRRPAVRLA